MILVAIVVIMLVAIVVGLTLDDKTDPTQLPRLGNTSEHIFYVGHTDKIQAHM